METVKETIQDPSHNIWGSPAGELDAFFKPKVVAVIGATEKEHSVGRTILSNLLKTPFGGTVFPVNPNRTSVLGIQSFPSISRLPLKPDLAVIVTPAKTVPGVVAECVQAGIKNAIIISAGFKELGAPGIALEQEILKIAGGKMRIIGPNCLGVMSPVTGLNATFASRMALPGRVAFISQSGALCTSVLDWSIEEKVGFSFFASIGSMLDVDWGDLINYLGDDPKTKSILIYMETVGDARAFLSAAREVALTKPIIVLKPGRSDAAMKAAASHTGSIAGSDRVLDAAFRRCGVLRVNEIRDLFNVAEILAKQPAPNGPRLTILTNAGGPGVLATDALIQYGGKLAALSDKAQAELNAFLPEHWSHANPVDILGDADPERFAKALSVLVNDSETDGLLVVLTPQAMTDPTVTAEKLAETAKKSDKPVLASWMGEDDVLRGRKVLRKAGIPDFPYPDEAAKLYDYMWQYKDNLRSLYETPVLPKTCRLDNQKIAQSADEILSRVRKDKRTILTEDESKTILSSYGIPVTETLIAESAEKAVEAAKKIGFPVVLKLNSHVITHKTDVGGVVLNLNTDAQVKAAFVEIEKRAEAKQKGAFGGVSVQPMITEKGFELILGSSVDAQFGPVILFGAGGIAVEVFKDFELGLPPLNTTLARRMIERTKISKVLGGFRGEAPINQELVEEIMVRFSQLVAEQAWIKEIDVNPLFVSSKRCVALDARIVLHEPGTAEKNLSKPAIRPYPIEYIQSLELKNGQKASVRPIRPEDEPMLVQFHKALSEKSVQTRYMGVMSLDRRIAHERLVRVCFNDYDRDLALVVDVANEKTKDHEIVAIARLSIDPLTREAEYSMIVSDSHQGQGLGSKLAALSMEIARKENLKKVWAEMLTENVAMRKILQKLKFKIREDLKDGLVKAVFEK